MAGDKKNDDAAPEVEAEIVGDDAALMGDLGQDVSDAGNGGEAEDGKGASGADIDDVEPSHVPKKSTLTSGVILFILFMLMALATLAVWYARGGNKPTSSESSKPNTSAQTVTPNDLDDSASAGSVAPPVDKISNAAITQDARGFDKVTSISGGDSPNPVGDTSSEKIKNTASDIGLAQRETGEAARNIAGDQSTVAPELGKATQGVAGDSPLSEDNTELSVENVSVPGDGLDAEVVDDETSGNIEVADSVENGSIDEDPRVSLPASIDIDTAADVSTEIQSVPVDPTSSPENEEDRLTEETGIGEEGAGEMDAGEVKLLVDEAGASDAASQSSVALQEASVADSGGDIVASEVPVSELLAEADAIKVQNEALEQELTVLKQSLAAQSETFEERLKNERARSAELDAELDAVRQSLDQAKITQDETSQREIRQLKEDLARLESESEAADAKRLSALLAVTAIERALTEGRPFADDLSSLRAALDDPRALQEITSTAQAGISSPQKLAEEFQGHIRAILSEADSQSAKGMTGKIMARAKAVFSVRPATPQPGDRPRAIISRVEAALQDGQIAKALDEIDAFAPEVIAPAAAWVEEARQYAHVHDMVVRLRKTLESENGNSL